MSNNTIFYQERNILSDSGLIMEPKYLLVVWLMRGRFTPFPFHTLREPIDDLSVLANALARASVLFLRV